MIEFLTTELRSHNCLVVAFTGAAQGFGAIPFEFHRTMTGADCAVLFVRDRNTQWYQYGLGEESSPDRVEHEIREAKLRCGAKRLVMIGNSMGGFGALLFSRFVPTDAVLAFVPQTVILPEELEALGDLRWIDTLRTVPTFYFGDLATLSPPSARVTLVFGSEEPLDREHSERLSRVWNCELVEVAGSGHDATKTLRDRDQLAHLISGAIKG